MNASSIGIILIHSDFTLCTQVKALLSHGIGVDLLHVTHSMSKGIEAVRQLRPDLVLVGWPLPDEKYPMDTIAYLDQLDERPGIIVMLQAMNQRILKQAFDRGADAYLISEDLDLVELDQVIHEVYSRIEEARQHDVLLPEEPPLSQTHSHTHPRLLQPDHDVQRIPHSGLMPVFLSYSRTTTEQMWWVNNFLLKRGIPTWNDSNIEQGTPNWRFEIQHALDSAGAITVLFSPGAKKSQWVSEEISYAQHQGVKVFGLLVAGEPRDSIPFGCTTLQYGDLRDSARRAVQMRAYIQELREHLESLARH